MISSPERVDELLRENRYIGSDSISTAIYMASLLKKPLLVEGPAGVGKTEIAKVISSIFKVELIRLQCYEGLDAHHAIYEWNYQRQLLYLKMNEKEHTSVDDLEKVIYHEDFLLKRPLLQAIDSDKPTVLLIDEIDRADEEFESYFLELLSDWQISIPELGTIKAKNIPIVVLTSNRMRQLSDALRRRCLYLWIDFPSFEKELEIVQTKIPDINDQLAREICDFIGKVREMKLEKLPGIAETLDWAMALTAMHISHLDKKIVESTLGVILKDWQDIRETSMSLSELLHKVGVTSKLS